MYKRLFRSFLLSLCLLLLPLSGRADAAPASAPLTAGSAQNGMVRVRLAELESASTLNLTIFGSYSVNGQADQALPNGASVTVKFSASTGQWTLTAGASARSMGASFRLCRHESGGQSGVKIAQARVPGNLYPGDFQFIAKSSGGSYAPLVVVHIYMEDYLYGVLPYEMGDFSGMEALKAQAVAARTYTMNRMSQALSSLWDVVDTTADQVYSGTPSGSASCKAAVDATKGIVVKNGGAFTNTYYTASNGGQTESIKNAWGSANIPYLTVKDDPYDLANPDSRKASFFVSASGKQSNAALDSLIRKKAAAFLGADAQVTAVTAVTPRAPRYSAPSRLYTQLEFSVRYTRNGETYSGALTFDIFSELEGPLSMSLNSGANELWSVAQENGGFTVTARRFGHGIGMSQRGAMYMADMGYTYDQILGFYYEGCARVEYTLTRSILSAPVPGKQSQEQVIPEAPVSLETPVSSLTAVVTTDGGSLNLRARPSADAKVLRTIPAFETIPILEKGEAWCKTAYGGSTGYVMASFLTFPGESAPAPAQTAAPAQPSPVSPGVTARVVTQSGSLNLRAKASASAKVLRTIPPDDFVRVLQAGDSWCQVTYEGVTGYVMTSFLAFESASSPPSQGDGLRALALPVVGQVMSTAGSLNLRAEPSTQAAVLLEMPKYDYLVITAVGDTWCAVQYEGLTGYCMTKYLEFDLYEE